MKTFITALMMSSSMLLFAQTNQALLQKLVSEEAHGNIIQVFTQPNVETEISAEYDFTEMPLKPQDVVYFYVPERLAKSTLSQVGFSHRQRGSAPERDPYPGLTSALIYSTDVPGDELRYWGGHSSGKLGAKFAEYRPSGEFDALYEWPRLGHKGINNKSKSLQPIRPNVLRLQNVGVDTVWLSKAYVEVVPLPAKNYQVEIFTPKSDFGDPVTMKSRWYGGGQVEMGTFPNALRLSSRDHSYQPKLPANMRIEKNKIFITLPVGEKFSSVDIMVGDTHPDRIRNKDNGWGSLGNAKLSVTIENARSNQERVLLSEKNVGPQGVISASDVTSAPVVADGDVLVIKNEKHSSTAYIMGLRIGTNPVK
jgi:hypothetical protein